MLVLDEPTSSLDADEVAELFRVIRTLKESGVAILFVSHFLDQVYEISDRLTVLRNGRLVGEYRTDELLRIELVQKMIGKEMAVLDEIERPAPETADADDELTPFVAGDRASAARASIEPIDLTIYEGEVVGLAGLLGSGRTELARILSGVDRPDTGTLTVRGTPTRFRIPARRPASSGSPTPRRTAGPRGSSAISPSATTSCWRCRPTAAGSAGSRGGARTSWPPSYIEALQHPTRRTRTPWSATCPAATSRRCCWPAGWRTAPRLLILDEPTRGIDIGAKAEIQKLVADLADNGMSVLFISAELEEVLRLSHRVVVLRDRRKVADLDNDDLTRRPISCAVIADGSAHAPDGGLTRLMQRSSRSRLFWPVVLLLVLFVVNLVAFPGFFPIDDQGRPSVRQPDRHPAQRRADPDRRDRDDSGHRHPGHRPVGRRGLRDRRCSGLLDHPRLARPGIGRRRSSSPSRGLAAVALVLGLWNGSWSP